MSKEKIKSILQDIDAIGKKHGLDRDFISFYEWKKQVLTITAASLRTHDFRKVV